MKPEDVSIGCWEDFLAHRKSKRAIVTDRVIKRIREEANKAGWSLEEALNECVDRGWQGFKAEWVSKRDRKLEMIFGMGDANGRSVSVSRTIDAEVRNPLRLAKG
jgi:hypothetical protein